MQTTLEERIERLERENRRLKRIGAGAALVIACFFAAAVTSSVRAQPKAKMRILEAEKFVVKDAQGRVRGEFGTSNSGDAVSLDLRDAATGNSGAGASLTIDKEGTSLLMRDAMGKPRASLIIDGSGTTLGLHYATDVTIGGLGGVYLSDAYAGPSLLLKGSTSAALSVENNRAGLVINDSKGSRRVYLQVRQPGGLPEIGLNDENGNAYTSLSVDEKGAPELYLNPRWYSSAR